MSEQQHMVLVAPVSSWARQADEALEALRTGNGGHDPVNLRAAYDVDQRAFTSLIEAMVALEPVTGRPVSQELVSLARLRPVDEVIQ